MGGPVIFLRHSPEPDSVSAIEGNRRLIPRMMKIAIAM
jgi:hypothetical protein